MSQVEQAIQASKRYEAGLEKTFGATGKGLHEKLEAVKDSVPVDIQRMLRFIASVRNKLVHDESYSQIDDIERFISSCEKLDQYFSQAQVQQVDRGEIPPIYDMMHNTAFDFREFGLAREVLNQEISAGDFVSKWEVMRNRHFDFDAENRDTLLMWLSGMIVHEMTNKPLSLYNTMADHIARFPQMGWNCVGQDAPLEKRPRKLSWWMSQYEQYIRHLFPRKHVGLKEIQFGVGWGGKDVIRLRFELPYIQRGIFGKHKYVTTPFLLDLVYTPFTGPEYFLPVDYQTYYGGEVDLQFKTKEGKRLRVKQKIDIENPVCRLKGAGERNTDIYIRFFLDNCIVKDYNGNYALYVPLSMEDFMKSKFDRTAHLFDVHEHIGEKTFSITIRADDGVPVIPPDFDRVLIHTWKDEPVHFHYIPTPCLNEH